VFGIVQWYFAEFLLSSHARNWFFMSDRVWSYTSRPGEWQWRFWGSNPREPVPTGLSLGAIANVGR
jgi:hypothetical protein